jgi:hypothetical protein
LVANRFLPLNITTSLKLRKDPAGASDFINERCEFVRLFPFASAFGDKFLQYVEWEFRRIVRQTLHKPFQDQ